MGTLEIHERTPRMQTQTEIDLKQFELLYSQLGELQKRFLSGTAAGAGLLLLGIVWFANTKDSAPFLKQFPHFLWVVALAPVLGALLYSYSAWLVHKKSQKIATSLDYFDPMPREVYETNAISRGQFFVFSAGVVLLSMIL